VNVLSAPLRKVLGLVSVGVCVVFAFLLLKGSWDYWANFANLPKTTGRWFPLGFEESFRGKGWYESYDIPMPEVLRFMEDVFNDGDEYEKIPRLIPYFVMPLSMALLLFRFLQAGWFLWQGRIETIIASHEVEDELEAAAAARKD
ncbi:MAG: TRAP transporter small permease, partial [Pseudomonadota bacterium]